MKIESIHIDRGCWYIKTALKYKLGPFVDINEAIKWYVMYFE